MTIEKLNQRRMYTEAYRRNCAYVKVLFDMLDGAEYRVGGADPDGKRKLDLRYMKEMQLIAGITARDFIQVSDRMSVRIDYIPRLDDSDIVYVFHMTLSAGYTELGYIERVEIGEDWAMIIAGGTSLVLNLFRDDTLVDDESEIRYMPKYIRRLIMHELNLDAEPEVFGKYRSPDYMVYNYALRPGYTTVPPSDGDVRITVGNTTMPLNSWKRRLHTSRREIEELVTIAAFDTIDMHISKGNMGAIKSEDPEDLKVYEFNGAYRTLQEWSKHLHISRALIKERLAQGMTFEEAVTAPINKPSRAPRKKSKDEYYEYKGVTKSLREWAEFYDIPYVTLKKRINKGMTIKRAINGLTYGKMAYTRPEQPLQVKKPGYIVAERRAEEEAARKARDEQKEAELRGQSDSCNA